MTYEHTFAIIKANSRNLLPQAMAEAADSGIKHTGGGAMPQDKWSAITLCPYYRSHSEVGIYCEGPVTQSHLTLEFANRAQR